MGNLGLSSRPSARVGHNRTAISAWYGLRYGTARRFAPPTPASGSAGVSSLAEVPIFPQRPSRLAVAMGHGEANPQSEDAFFANIWAPDHAAGLPVLLFIHGGAWMTGGGSMQWYDGGVLASQGLVVVTVNYRLAALGHLGDGATHPLPLPAADLLLALRWTIEHIHAYGGDPDRITVVGQSAGGWYGHLLSVLPQTRGMVHRVAHLSMGTRSPWTTRQQADVTRAADQFLDGPGITNASPEEVLVAGARALPGEPPALGHAPAGFLPVATAKIPARLFDPSWAARACHAEAVYLRYTADESAVFFFDSAPHTQATQEQVDQALSAWDTADLPHSLTQGAGYAGAASGLPPYRQLVAASSWRQFQRFPTEYAAALHAVGGKARLEVFTEESPQTGLHSAHCFDLPFQFGQRRAWADAPMLRGLDQDRFAQISADLLSGLARFVGAV